MTEQDKYVTAKLTELFDFSDEIDEIWRKEPTEIEKRWRASMRLAVEKIISDTKKAIEKKIQSKLDTITFDLYCEGEGTYQDGVGHFLNF